MYADSDNGASLSPDSNMDVIAEGFFVNNRPISIPHITSYCPALDCVWPHFETLGVCGECKEVSSQLQFACLREDGSWQSDWTPELVSRPDIFSCGYFFNASSSAPMLMTGYAVNSSETGPIPTEALISRQLNLRDPRTEQHYWDRSINFKHIRSPILNFITAAVPDAASAYHNKTPVAHECVLNWCTKTIAATFREGSLSENILSTFTNDTMVPNPLVNDAPGSYWYTQNITITPPGQDRTFFVPNDTVLQTIFAFDFVLPNYLTQANTTAPSELRYYNDMNTTTNESAITGHSRTEVYNSHYWTPPNNVSQNILDLSTAMTNLMRTYPDSFEKVQGSGSLESYINVSWAWFSLPIVLVFFTLIFLAGTILQSRKQAIGIWKTSSLAVLSIGLNPDVKKRVESHSLLELFEKSCETKVLLQAEKGGYAFTAV
jgi:hypothetical protein